MGLKNVGPALALNSTTFLANFQHYWTIHRPLNHGNSRVNIVSAYLHIKKKVHVTIAVPLHHAGGKGEKSIALTHS
jgi:hypothetical protein